MTNTLHSRIRQFFDQYPPHQVSRHLRAVLIGYLQGQLETGYPPDFQLYLWEFDSLFDILDCAADTERQMAAAKKRENSSKQS
jgi:hypothetical protein